MTNYNYIIDLSSWFVVSYLIVKVIWGAINSIIDYTDVDKKDVNVRLKSFHKINPLFKKMFPLNKVKKAITYSLEHTHLSDLSDTLHGTLGTVLMVFGVYPFAIHTLESLFPSIGFINNLVILMLISSVFGTLISIPFSLKSTFDIEQRYGFNKQTKKMFYIDTFKSFVISNVILVSIAYSLHYILHLLFPLTLLKSLIVAALIIVISLGLEWFQMTIGISIFNKLTPLKNKRLSKKVNKLFKKCGYKKNPKLFAMDQSTRSTHANAWVGGFGSNKKIVLFDTLLKTMTDNEIITVLCHEIGHEKNHDLIKGRIISMLKIFAISALISTMMYNINLLHSFGYRWITAENISTYQLLGFMLSFRFITTFLSVLSPLSSYRSRNSEYKADEYSIRHTNNGKAMISSIAKLYSDSLGDIFPSKWNEMFNFDHPSISNRVEYMQKVIKEMKNEKHEIKGEQ